ncbi:MAG: sigma-70 family RNA polymerase sigma factor, partial [Planctomycetota bacterium]
MSHPVLPRIASGDQQAVEECLDRYGGLVWSLASRYCRGAIDTDDAVQEVFIALWKSADRYDPEIASEPTFVTMISRRRLIDMLRRKRSPESETGATSEPVEEVAAPTATAAVELSEEASRVKELMQQLSDEQRR